jgi:UDP-N-acetylglucosamine--N-acetylmuramyl-(pentapeptide) pyrophosphoryl-undecaprenol N-acetylglucosamine transferase
MRILFYAVNGLGLGHVTRLLAIAREIRKIRPTALLLFLTTSESNVIYKEGFPAVKIPSKNIVCVSGFKIPLHIRIMHETAWSVFSSFQPDITIVDTFPHGFSHELDQVLRWKASRFVYIYRQRKDEKLDDDYFHSLLNRYQLIIVPHERGEAGVRIPRGLNVFYAGPILIRNRNEVLPRERIIRAFGLPQNKKLILINLGGGGQDNLHRIMGRIVNTMKHIPGIHPVIAQGSLLHYLPMGECTVINGYYPVCELYTAFDAVVAGCGYNTVNELLYFHKPALYIPFWREVDDQFRRAAVIENKGMGLSVTMENRGLLQEKLTRLLDRTVHRSIIANIRKAGIKNNARMAARAIISLIRKK